MPPRTTCPGCEAPLETPFCCVACGRLLRAEGEPTPFEAFGLEPGYGVDAAELERRLLRFSRRVHPDFFAAAGEEERALAEESSAALNAAYEILADDVRRADWLVTALDGPSEADEKEMPREFLLEVLEWSEEIENAREAPPGAPERARLSALAGALRARRAECVRGVAGLLAPAPERGAPALAEARRLLNAVRYLDRALRELEVLRLEEAAAR